MIGKTILHYKVLDELGRGGMGVVYKAVDTKLKREVALKFLPGDVLQGKAEKNRFTREAQAAAALNHANIGLIYAIEEVDNRMFIAMEYIDGRSLREIICPENINRPRPLPLDKAIDYASQIAAGLQAAHEKGVVHRDIKSANIMVTEKGVVKIMDFGLAKLADRSKITTEGSTVGTVAYMSPEQAQGVEVDSRSDIWSLGVVLYEMISGELPFKGEYEQAVIYSILNTDPEPLTGLRSGIPVALDGIIYKAFAKDPDIRYQHVDELPADLKAIDMCADEKSGISRTMTAPVSRILYPSRSVPPIFRWITVPVVILLAIACFLAAWFLKPESVIPTQKIRHFCIGPTQDEQFTGHYAISQDGNWLAYVARDEKDQRIYLRKMDEIEAIPVVGTELARRAFFSPDGRWLGLVIYTQLLKIPTTGGSPEKIIDLPGWEFFGVHWGSDDMIIYGVRNSGLLRISASGGDPEVITELDTARGELHHKFPLMLPGEKHLLFVIEHADSKIQEIAILSLETGEKRILSDQGGRLLNYIPTGHILFKGAAGLMAAPFDQKKLEITGSPVPVFDEVVDNAVISADGILLYDQVESGNNQGLVWVDRRGGTIPLLEQPGTIRWPRISPDGKSIAFVYKGSIWIYDTDRQIRSRFTSMKTCGEPAWTPDGRRIAFWSDLPDYNIYWKPVDGGSEADPLLVKEEDTFPSSWSPDGKNLLYYGLGQSKGHDIGVFPMGGEPYILISSPFDERLPMVSPDGRWIAYVSNESGRDEVYVQPFPDLSKRWLISNEGGNEPVWARNDQELYYRNATKLVVVRFETEPEFRPEIPALLFEGEYVQDINFDRSYDVSPDGKRFVMIENLESSPAAQLHVIVNWFEEVKRRTKGNN
jgi:serine/threonine-protein kinase